MVVLRVIVNRRKWIIVWAKRCKPKSIHFNVLRFLSLNQEALSGGYIVY